MGTIRKQIEDLFHSIIALLKIGAIGLGSYIVAWVYFWFKETPTQQIIMTICLIIGTPIAVYVSIVWILERIKFRVTAYETHSPTEESENSMSKPPEEPFEKEILQSRGGRPRKVTIDQIYEMLMEQGVIPADTEPFSRSEKEWEELYKYWSKNKKATD